MQRSSIVPRLALLPGLAMLVGTALGVAEHLGPATLAGAIPVLLVGALGTPPVRGRQAMLLALAGCLAMSLGFARGRLDRLAHVQRVAALFRGADTVERVVDVTVLAAPVETPDGTLTLPVREGDLHLRIGLRVRVPEGAPADLVTGLRRGDRCRVAVRFVRGRLVDAQAAARRTQAQRARGEDLVAWVKNPRLFERLERGRPGPRRALDVLRAAARRRLARALGDAPDARAIVAAMTLGDAATLEGRTREAFRDAGLAHLLAISGLHVSMVLGVWFFALPRAGGKAPTFRLALGSAGAAGLAVLVGAGAPVVRAAALAVYSLLAGRLGRRHDALHALALVAAAMAAYCPPVVLGIGFQLSFAATAGLVLGLGAAGTPRPGFVAVLRRAFGAAGAAYVATTPIVAWHFGLLAPVSLLTGPLSTAACAAVLLSGALTIAGADLETFGAWLAPLARECAHAVLHLSESAGELPFATRAVARPEPWLVGVSLASWLLARHARERSASRAALTGIAVLALVLVHRGPPPRMPEADLEAHILDVGQGQAVLIRGRGGLCALVDVGPAREGFDAGERVVLPYVLSRGCTRLSALVITHPHADHLGGARAVVGGLDVDELWVAAGDVRDRDVHALISRVRERYGTAVRIGEAGDTRSFGGLEMSVLHPTRRDLELDTNDRSLAALWAARCGSVLIPGDAGEPAERRILARGEPIRASVLVLGHHGASRSSTVEWLHMVAPTLSVASAGWRNRFRHPHEAVLDRLDELGIGVTRTDLDGHVVWSCGAAGSSLRTGSTGEP